MENYCFYIVNQCALKTTYIKNKSLATTKYFIFLRDTRKLIILQKTFLFLHKDLIFKAKKKLELKKG